MAMNPKSFVFNFWGSLHISYKFVELSQQVLITILDDDSSIGFIYETTKHIIHRSIQI